MADFESLWQAVNQLKSVAGVLPMDVLDMPDPLGGIIRKFVRMGGMSLAEFAVDLDMDQDQARRVGDVLVQKGYLNVEDHAQDGQVTYRIYLARMRKRSIPLDL
jgi:hypothetical protein